MKDYGKGTCCKQCGGEFKTRNSKVFCCQQCYFKHLNENENYKEIVPTNKCKDCEKPILQTRVYCQDCRTIFLSKPRKRYKMTDEKNCRECGIEKTIYNTFSPEPGIWSTTCRKCGNKIKKKSKTDIKQLCVDYKGGKCEVCNYNKSLAALDFHHLDPTQKEFTLAKKRGCSFNDEIKNELDKCSLLCANCHREEHARLKDNLPSLLTEINQELNITINIPSNMASDLAEKAKLILADYIDHELSKALANLVDSQYE